MELWAEPTGESVRVDYLHLAATSPSLAEKHRHKVQIKDKGNPAQAGAPTSAGGGIKVDTCASWTSQSWTLHLNYKRETNGRDPRELGCVCCAEIGTGDQLQALVAGRESGDGRSLKEQRRWNEFLRNRQAKAGER